jgi:hypothetical protein
MRSGLLLVLTASLASLGSGCATLFAGGPDRVQVDSNPPGARVFVDNNEVGVTPTAVTLDRKSHVGAIKVEAAGYQPAVTQRAKKFNNVSFFNCFNPLAWGIDLLTGNYQEFDKSPVSVSLVPFGYAAPGPGQPPYPQQPGYPPAQAPGRQPAGYPQQPVQPYPPQPAYPQPYPQQGYPPPGYPPPPPQPAPRRR